MRPDMKKVVVERPRGQSNVPNRKFGARLAYIPDHDYEEQPKRVGVSASYRDYAYSRKWFTDVLGPLERYLRSNVGRPWNKVYSEMCTGLDRRKVTGLHVFQHLEQFVERDAYFNSDGKPWALHNGWEGPVHKFYVHPTKGILCEARTDSSARQRRRARLLARDVSLLHLNDNRGYRKHNEIWYRVKLKRIEVSWKSKPLSVWDIFLKCEVTLSGGVHWIAQEKKQCNRKELAHVRTLLAERERKIKDL